MASEFDGHNIYSHRIVNNGLVRGSLEFIGISPVQVGVAEFWIQVDGLAEINNGKVCPACGQVAHAPPVVDSGDTACIPIAVV